jgi:hypothetical protein
MYKRWLFRRSFLLLLLPHLPPPFPPLPPLLSFYSLLLHLSRSEEAPPNEAQELPPSLVQSSQPRRLLLLQQRPLEVNRLSKHVDLPALLTVDVQFDTNDGLVEDSGVDFEGRELGVAVGGVLRERRDDVSVHRRRVRRRKKVGGNARSGGRPRR